MTLFHLLVLAVKRLKSRLGLTSLFLLATVLAIGVVACIPVFAGAVSARILQEELGMLSDTRRHIRPFSVRYYASATASRPLDIGEVDKVRDWLTQSLLRSVDVPLDAIYVEVQSPRYDLMPTEGDTRYDEESLDQVYVVYAEGVEQVLGDSEGAPFGQEQDAALLNVWIPRRYADEHNLRVGERYVVGNLYDPAKGRMPVLIAGIWEPRDPDDQFWWYTDTIWDTDGLLLTTRQAYERHVYAVHPAKTQVVNWRFVMDEQRMNFSRAQQYINGLKGVQKEVELRLPRGGMDKAPTEYLLRGERRKNALTVVLLGFSVPLLILILYSVVALSAVLARFQAQELAMLTSRGSSRIQIVVFALVETLFVLVLAVPLGLGASLLMARFLGYSKSFLTFIARDPLPVYLNSVDWRLVGIVVAAIALARLIPTMGSGGRTIVQQERASTRWRWVVGPARLLLIGFFVAATYYATYRLSQVGNLALISWESGTPSHDPLLLAAPSLFFLTAPMILAELFVMLVRPLGWLGRLAKPIALYLGMQDLGREGAQYHSPTYMLILCLSLGVFYASLALSADTWAVDRRRYEVGSDLLYNPRGTAVVAGRYGKVDEASDFYEPAFAVPLSEFEQAPGVLAVTPVGEFEASILVSKVPFVRLLAVDRLTFPQVAYYREDYAPETLGVLMNRLGSRQDAILVPRQVAAEYQLEMGSRINLNVLVDEQTRVAYDLTVVGIFDYFPTMFHDEVPMLVTNLEYLQSQGGGLLPYGIWMRTDPKTEPSKLVQGIISRSKVIPERVVNLRQILEKDAGRLERVGVFGMLSICFLAGTVLAVFGLLVHNAASLRKRSLRFAVLQALGLARINVLLTVFTEYLGVMLYSIIAGVVLGIVGATIYVPYFQLTEEAVAPVPPYLPLVDLPRAGIIALVMGLALVAVEAMVLWRLLRIRLFETLRLGTRE